MFCMPNQKSGVETNVGLGGVGFLQTQSVQKCLVLCIIRMETFYLVTLIPHVTLVLDNFLSAVAVPAYNNIGLARAACRSQIQGETTIA